MAKSPTQLLLTAVRIFLRETGMPPTVFGSRAIGDPSLVNDLIAGRELRHRTLSRVEAFMSSYTGERKSA
jgi:hypothetical protein